MDFLAFASFAALIVAWLFAPSHEPVVGVGAVEMRKEPAAA